MSSEKSALSILEQRVKIEYYLFHHAANEHNQRRTMYGANDYAAAVLLGRTERLKGFFEKQSSLLGRVAACYAILGDEDMARGYARMAATEYFVAHPGRR